MNKITNTTKGMQRKISLLLGIMMIFSCFNSLISLAAETKINNNNDNERKIESIEDLPEHIRNSEWFKNSLKAGVYEDCEELDNIGEYYMGEHIVDILLMCETIKDFNLENFLSKSTYKGWTVDDLSGFRDKGYITLEEAHKKEVKTTTATIATTATTKVTKTETKNATKTISTIDELPKEVRNSKWFKQGQAEGLYSHFTEWPLVGKGFLGESIDTILLMNEEIKDFNLETFLGSSVCSIYTIEDLKEFKKQGMNTITDVYEQVYLPTTQKQPKMFKMIRNVGNNIQLLSSGANIPSVGATQWGTITVTASKMYENSDAAAMVGAFRNAGIINNWYISLFDISLSDFSGEFAWLNGKTFNSIGNATLLGGDLSSFVRCLSPKKAAPSATMKTSVLVKIDTLDEAGGRIKVSINSSSFGSGYQAIGGPIWLEYTFPEPAPKTGYVKIHKASSATNITGGNSNYSVKGSKFSVYSATSAFTYDDLIKYAQGGANTHGFEWYGNFITLPDGTAREQAYVSDGYELVDEPEIGSILAKKENGRDYYWYYNKNNSLINLPVGDYYLVEEFTPSLYGYCNNNTIKPFTVTANNTTDNPIIVNFTNIPNLDPINIVLSKVDAETTGNIPQGSASLAGAQFTVKFYPSIQTTNEMDLIDKTPQYTWTITTDEDGFAEIPAAQLPTVTYPDGTIQPGLPYGTISIQETKAPAGYIVDNHVYLVKITAGSNAGISTYNAPTIPNEIIRGGFSMEKNDKDRLETNTSITSPQGGGNLQATFSVTNVSGNPVTVNGQEYANNAVCYTFQTDATGKFTSPNNIFPYGSYVIKETVAPTGYQVNNAWSAKFDIRTNGVIVPANSTTNNPLEEQIIRGGVKIQKIDNEINQNMPLGNATLSGAKFEITNKSAQAVYTQLDGVWGWRAPNAVCYTITTNEHGVAQTPVDALPYGTYSIKEVESPVGYLLNADWSATFNITANGTIVDLSNNPVKEQVIRGGIQLVKFKEDDNEIKTPLAGIEFTLTHEKTGEKIVITTDANGYATTSDTTLMYGNWRLEETKSPAGVIPIQPVTINIDTNKKILYYIVENQIIKTPVQIVKEDATTGKIIPLADTEFQIRNVATGQIMEFTVNYPEVYKTQTLKTGPSGTVFLPQLLEVGVYEAIEIKAPGGYLLSDTPVRFEVTGGGTYANPLVVKIADNPAMGRILIDKTGEIYVGTETEEHPLIGTVHKAKFAEGGQITGAKFEVVAANDIVTPDGTVRHKAGEVVDTIITTEHDDYSKNLYLGKYIVREKEAAPGYVKDTKEYPVELKYADQNTAVVTEKVSIDNRWLNSKVDVTKEAQELIVVEDKNTVKTVINVKAGEGFLFALYADEDIKDIKKDTAVAYGTTDAEGKLILEGKFLHGKYYLKEIYTNSAFKPNDTKHPVDLTYDPASVKIEVSHKLLNELITTEVTLTKTDITGENPVPGATIEVKNEKGEVVYKDVTDADGQIKEIKLTPGKYTFTETLAPSGFALNTAVMEFEITQNLEVIGHTVIKDDYSRIWLKKLGISKDYPLEGAKFGLFKIGEADAEKMVKAAIENIIKDDENSQTPTVYPEGELIAEAISDKDGNVVFEKVPYGEYVVRELEAPKGWIAGKDEYYFLITGIYENQTEPIEVYNDRSVTITKTDITGENPVPGAEIEITDKDGNVIYKEVTDENGQIPNISISKPGKYVFKETLAPSGFALNPNTYEFTVNEDGSITGDTSIKNDYTRIEILKLDENSRPLAGVEFTMFDKDGNAVITAISDANGLVKFEGFEHGEYIIKETKTLEGYMLSGEVIELNVDGTYVNPAEPIEFVNYKTPKTGFDGFNKTTYLGVGIAVIAIVGIASYLVIKKKKEVK